MSPPLGKGEPTLSVISPFSTGPPSMTAKRGLGGSRALHLGAVGRTPGVVGRLDESGSTDPGPAQPEDLVEGQRGDIQVEHRPDRGAGQHGNQGHGQVGRRIPPILRHPGPHRDGEGADAHLRRRQRGTDGARVQNRAADVDAVVDAREHQVRLRAPPHPTCLRSPKARATHRARRRPLPRRR